MASIRHEGIMHVIVLVSNIMMTLLTVLLLLATEWPISESNGMESFIIYRATYNLLIMGS